MTKWIVMAKHIGQDVWYEWHQDAISSDDAIVLVKQRVDIKLFSSWTAYSVLRSLVRA